jgi:hypothetical protein
MKQLWFLLVIGACACAGQPTVEQSQAPATGLREPFTEYFEVSVDGVTQGYLLRYNPIPLHSDVTRSLPTGTHRVFDARFEEVGFVSPRGEWRRHGDGGISDAVGSFDLRQGVQEFFGLLGRVRIVSLREQENS